MIHFDKHLSSYLKVSIICLGKTSVDVLKLLRVPVFIHYISLVEHQQKGLCLRLKCCFTVV